jgi:hypothetical protein
MTLPLSMEEYFPNFADYTAIVDTGDGEPYIELGPVGDIAKIELDESILGVPYPHSYKLFLQLAREVVSLDGGFQMGPEHPFLLSFPPFAELSSQHQLNIARRGGDGPPPSDGMLCFAEYWIEGEGDQAAFDVRHGLIDGEYPVYYYNHDQSSVRKLANGFYDFIEKIVPGKKANW